MNIRRWLYKLIGGKLVEDDIRAESIGYSNWVSNCIGFGFPKKEGGHMMNCWELWDYYSQKSDKRSAFKKHGSQKTKKYNPVDNRNFIQEAMENGFEPHNGNKFSYDDGWFGCNILASPEKSPDRILVRGNKEIVLSLQGLAMRWPDKMDDGIEKLMKQCACRYLAFIKNKKILYETWSGTLPDRAFIDKFIQP